MKRDMYALMGFEFSLFLANLYLHSPIDLNSEEHIIFQGGQSAHLDYLLCNISM